MGAGAAEADKPSRAPGCRARRRAGEGEEPILLPHGYRHHCHRAERDTRRERPPVSSTLPMLRCRSWQPPHTICRRCGHRRVPLFAAPERLRGPCLRVIDRPTSWAYHLVYWAEGNHWSSRGGMTCSSVTKQPNGQAITDRPGDPNIWYIRPGYPRPNGTKPSQKAYIPTERMIPLGLASPAVGMAGTDAVQGVDRPLLRSAVGVPSDPELRAGPGVRSPSRSLRRSAHPQWAV